MSTALVPVATTDRADPGSAYANCRANADFIAQLIATRAQVPQTRARRRAEPEQAVAAYGALGQWPTRSGRDLCRLL